MEVSNAHTFCEKILLLINKTLSYYNYNLISNLQLSICTLKHLYTTLAQVLSFVADLQNSAVDLHVSNVIHFGYSEDFSLSRLRGKSNTNLY